MSRNCLQYNIYRAKLVKINNNLRLITNSDNQTNIHIDNIDGEEFIININHQGYLEFDITLSPELDKNVIINASESTKLTKLIVSGNSNKIRLNCDVSELYFGSCGVDLQEVVINTGNLPKIYMNEATIHSLKLNNLSANTTLYLGVSSHLLALKTNQKEIYIYKHVGYGIEMLSSNQVTKVNYIYLDPEKQMLDF